MASAPWGACSSHHRFLFHHARWTVGQRRLWLSVQNKKGYCKQERKTRWTAAKPARTWLKTLEVLGVFYGCASTDLEGISPPGPIQMQICCCVWRSRLLWKLDFLPGEKHASGCYLQTLCISHSSNIPIAANLGIQP